MKTIHKYVIDKSTNDVSTYENATFLHAANQHDQITVWAEVNTLNRECMRTLYIVGTGHKAPDHCDYVGSALMDGGRYVFHIYAAGETR
jgi:hypothetical protein